MNSKCLLFASLAAFTVNLHAQTILSGNHIIDGNLTVGAGGANKNLDVKGTSTLEGKVGVGVSNPGAQAHVAADASGTKGLIVQGTASQTANLQEWQGGNGTIFGSINALGNLSLNATPDAAIKIYSRQTGSAAGSYFFAGRFETDPGGSPLARAQGLHVAATGYNNTSDSATGIDARAYALGSSGTLPKQMGVSASAYHTGSGINVTTSFAFQGIAGFYNSGSIGTIGTAYGMKLIVGGMLQPNQMLTTAYGIHMDLGAATDGYGLYIRPFGTDPSGQNYGLFIQGGHKNYMEGNVGIGTPNPAAKLDVNGNLKVSGTITASGTMNVTGTIIGSSTNGVVFGGTYGSGTIPVEGAGTRVMWQPGKGAFRAGGVSGTAWNNSNVGAYSVGLGHNTVASGGNSVALGESTSSTGYASTAFGNLSSAEGTESTAFGKNTRASGNVSTTFGEWTWAGGVDSTAFGSYTQASGHAAIAMGKSTKSNTYACLALGRNNVGSVATGGDTQWIETDPLLEVGNGVEGGIPSNAITVLKNGQTTLQNRFWNVSDPQVIPTPSEAGSGNALIVNGHAQFNGRIHIERQGDILMGEFGNTGD